MILDATAGNRTMWKFKHSDNIVYIDRNTDLERKPNIYCSNQQTPFPDKIFDTIFYDPPHSWGQKGHYHSYARRTEEYMKKWKDKAIPRYYGWDLYDTSGQLVAHIYHAQQEFRRILKDNGLLWVKWNEMQIPIMRILTIFSLWTELLRLYIKAPTQTASEKQTYWICLEKREKGLNQTILF